MKLLVRKGLTLSDVGELGRIIIPKARIILNKFGQRIMLVVNVWSSLLIRLQFAL